MPKRYLDRLLRGAASALGLVAMLGSVAEAATAPIVVVEVDSGKVIYSQAATDPWFPASITKLMTTYVALDLVRQGRASMDTLLTISPTAAAEPPSKMGFRPGTQLTLDNALKIIMVKSANDVSWAIGEGLGGSVDGFADMMNETARRIGMRESRWYNPNGLPEPRQWTSARDMAILGRALMRDFPDHQDLFSISAIQYGKAVMANHNGLLGRYPGTDGMKTGFICSGGFNVVASATRGGRRIIAVVMGQPSARLRDLKAADLFDYGFSQSAGWTAPTLEALPSSNIAEPPDMRAFICGGKKQPPVVDEGQGALSANVPGDANAQLIGAAAPGSSVLAFATLNSPNLRGRTLPPRAPLQPIAVWTGRSPAESAAAIEAEEQQAQNSKSAKLEAAKQKREAARQAKAERAAKSRAAAVIDPKTPKAIADRKAAKGSVPTSASAYTPVEDEKKPAAKSSAKSTAKKAGAHATPTAKAESKAESKPAAKPGARKKASDKSAAASE